MSRKIAEIVEVSIPFLTKISCNRTYLLNRWCRRWSRRLQRCRDMLVVLVCWGILRKRHKINKTPEPAHSKQSQILKFKLDAYPGRNSTHCLADSSRNGLGEGARKVFRGLDQPSPDSTRKAKNSRHFQGINYSFGALVTATRQNPFFTNNKFTLGKIKLHYL